MSTLYFSHAMKNGFLLFFLFTLTVARSQVFTDTFSDGDFSTDPVWNGDELSFIVNDDNELQLQGDCDAGGENYLSVQAATNDTATWECYVRMGFNPSGSNNARIYLQSNGPDLQAPLQGYFLQIGEDGSDDAIRLYRQDGTDETLIMSGTAGAVSETPEVRIRVVRTTGNEWQLYCDYTGGTDLTLETFAEDPVLFVSGYMGLVCDYTSTRCDDFFFDDFFAGPLYTDEDAPVLLAVDVLSGSQLELTFNEAIDPASAGNESNYVVDGGVGNPIDATVTGTSTVLLTFEPGFPSGVPLNLETAGIADLAGNVSTLQVIGFSWYTVSVYDLLINEIMADPEPVVGLPAEEYIELLNNTDLAVDLTGFTFSDSSSASDPFPGVTIPAGGFLILTDEGNEGLFSAYGAVLGIDGFPSLNNTGDRLSLRNPDGVVIHTVFYDDSWYGNPIKEDGGYSLELIDPSNPCQGMNNWTASNAEEGGTPGVLNSVFAENPDTEAPFLVSVFPVTDMELEVLFSETITEDGILLSSFTIDNGIGNPTDVLFNGEDQVTLQLSGALEPGVIYTLTCSGVADCSGNEIAALNTLSFGIPEEAEPGDLVINEILFNPGTGGSDFLELYNKSQKLIDLSVLRVVELDPEDPSVILEFGSLSEEKRLLLPGQFFVITEDLIDIGSRYTIGLDAVYVESSDMPNFPDDEGIVRIETNGFTMIDQLHFFDDWHYGLLDDEDGVSLERLRYDLPTEDPENWHSAAEDAGFATPGRINSMFGEFTATGATFEAAYPVFSPDGDGFRDIMVINYTMPGEGYTANIRLFDTDGRQAGVLANNLFLAASGVITWDGLLESGEEATMGIYILFAEVFNLEGDVQRHKLKFTLSARQ